MALTLSCAFATGDPSHEHARIAEDLGYARSRFYASPTLYPDVRVPLSVGQPNAPKRIGLGPGVLVPHPMTNAGAVATLASIAGRDRVAVGIGSGFTGRLTMIAANERDRPFVTGELLAAQGLADTKEAWRERAALGESQGATEIADQPAGPDVPRELAAFAPAIRG